MQRLEVSGAARPLYGSFNVNFKIMMCGDVAAATSPDTDVF